MGWKYQAKSLSASGPECRREEATRRKKGKKKTPNKTGKEVKHIFQISLKVWFEFVLDRSGGLLFYLNLLVHL